MIPVLAGVIAGNSRSENGVASLAYVPAISLFRAMLYNHYRDHRDTPLRGGPVMTEGRL
jgi:hypothetical protein